MNNLPIDLVTWAHHNLIENKEWLILGKGPSFGLLSEYDTEKYAIASLNHVIRETSAFIAHFIDLDAAIECSPAIYTNAKYLMMPFYPHINYSPSEQNIFQLSENVDILKRMRSENRLVFYNHSVAKAKGRKPYENSPIIVVTYFSSEAALNLLVSCGVKTIRSLGIDGGNSYGSRFHDLKDKTLLSNGIESFDKQFIGIAKTLRKSDIFYAPLNMEAPIKIFVGSDHAQMAGVKVLEFSIKKYATASVDLEAIDDRDVPIPIDPSNRTKTGFSFSRFLIPELCNYKGKGIYLDADMQLFTDISKLWNTDFDGRHVLYSYQSIESGRTPQFSVLLLDCAKLKDWKIHDIIKGFDDGKYSYGELMQQFCIVPDEFKAPSLDPSWNSLEHYEAGVTNLIHYTDMPTQPWVSDQNKNGYLWYDCVKEAIADGFLSPDYLYEEISKGNVSPFLASWVGLENPPKFNRLVKKWVPPFRRFSPSNDAFKKERFFDKLLNKLRHL